MKKRILANLPFGILLVVGFAYFAIVALVIIVAYDPNIDDFLTVWL